MSDGVSNNRVIAIGLDSAEWDLVEKWIAQDRLPNLKLLMNKGLFSKVKGGAACAYWISCLTGCKPESTGYWSLAKIRPDYRVQRLKAYEYDAYGLFYDYCGDRKIIALDVPHARKATSANIVRVSGWGAHAPQGPSESEPADLLEEINRKYGPHPALHNDDYLVWENEAKCKDLELALITGMHRRTDVCLDMMRERPWDLLFVVYGEVHAAGHGFLHLSQDDHPLTPIYRDDSDDPLFNVYEGLDECVGRLCDAAPDDAYVVVFSQTGMKTNSSDLPSWLFLPELMYRHSFKGKAAFARGDIEAPLPPYARQSEVEWMRAVWSLRADSNPFRRFIRNHARLRLSWHLEKLFGAEALAPTHPMNAEPYQFMPQMWFQNLWPDMKAFALPSFADGYVRINLAGRERQGKVAEQDFFAAVDEIADLLSDLKDARTGGPMVKELIRTREPGQDLCHVNPDADLIVIWTDTPTDVVDSSTYGRIGPAPFRRTGDHYPQGFYIATGPGLEPGELPTGELVDIAPTILDLMGVAKPNHFDGRSRLSVSASEYGRELL